MKEITVFTVGDSSELKHWSNVPFFFTDTLIKKNYKVNRVNLRESKFLTILLDKILFRFLKLIIRDHALSYNKTFINTFFLNKQIEFAKNKYRDTDAFIFLNFDYSIKNNVKPVMLFHDWTYEHYITNHICRKPYFAEKYFINQQKESIKKADAVISLFPNCADEMKSKYQTNNIFYLGNVINNFYQDRLDTEKILSEKSNSSKILFIGNRKYLEGAKLLIKTFEVMILEDPLLTLHIIGLENSHFEYLPQNVFCYGYLDKSNETEKNLYYNLLLTAKVFVNPTSTWGGFSSTVEAMYFYTPVVVSKYESFVETFGEIISFGEYNDNFDSVCLKESIKKVIYSNDYKNLSQNAHNSVSDFTWNDYIDKITSILNKVKK